jgi:hypothetical protein
MMKSRFLVITLVAILLLVFCAGSAYAATPDGLPGDVNGDGKINQTDMTRLQGIILLEYPKTPGADLNRDNKIDMEDIGYLALLITNLLGDMNDNGILDTGDISEIERVILSNKYNPLADINQNWIVDMGDVVRIDRIIYLLRQIKEVPIYENLKTN